MAGKTDFTELYEARDPCCYYEGLGTSEYQAPAHAAPVFRRLADVQRRFSTTPTILDVCCSFGVNAALLNYNLSFGELRGYYASRDRARRECLTASEMAATDRQFFAERRRPEPLRVIGLDIARDAVEYAVNVGLLADGLVADLELGDPTEDVTGRLADVDLVIVTGGASYVRERTFETIVTSAKEQPPWIAALTLRWVGFDSIAAVLERYGMVTERLDGYLVRQRRFSDADERSHVFASLAAHQVEPTPLEESGWHCAELFVARPRDTARDIDLTELLGSFTDDIRTR